MKFLYTPYLGAQDIEGIKKYKYAGEDQGPAYIYFYNPAATKLVEYLPDWLAPNLITLLGFLISFIPAVILFGWYGPNLKDDPENPIPNWVFFLQAFCYFAYRMLDEMDGK